MTAITGYEAKVFDEVWQEQLTEQLLQFARTHAWGWLTRWNRASVCPLNQHDMEDILSEVLIAVLRFRVPEGAKDWEPCLMAYIKRVAYRIYCRFRVQRHAEVSLEALPLESLPLASMDESGDTADGECVQATVQGLMRMPRHHALAFLLHLEADLAATLLQVGGTRLQHHLAWEELPKWVQQTPLRDREIAQLLGLTPRAVIRARQHARERLRACLQNLVHVRG